MRLPAALPLVAAHLAATCVAAVCLAGLAIRARGAEKAVSAAAPNPHATVLRDAGIEATAAGIAAYLEGLEPDETQQRRIDQLVAELGSDDFAVRERAMAALATMPTPPLARLQQAAGSDDFEVAWRARQIQRLAGSRGTQVLFAALVTIRRDVLAGLTEAVLRAFPHCTEDYVREAAIEALTATARPGDEAQLRAALAEDHRTLRRGAAAALCRLLGKSGGDQIASLLAADDEGVRYEAARALADIGDRRSLAALAALLDAEVLEIRAGADAALRFATGQSFGFTAYDSPQARAKQTAAWRAWLDEHGASAALRFPLEDRAAAELGRTLISLYNEHRVIEIDASGKLLLELKGYQGPWGAQRLPNGNLLVNWFSSHVVVEYAPDGKEVWKRDKLNHPWNAQRLPNGNTLVSCNNQVLELSPDGASVWEKTLSEHLADAQRLPSGNTLILVMSHAGPGKAVEVDPAGAVVWEIDGLDQPYRVQRLPSGNTLIVLKRTGRVVEYDPPGKNIVWQIEGLRSPDSAQRLASGRTLISDAAGLREYDAGGNVVWEHKLGSDRSIAWRY